MLASLTNTFRNRHRYHTQNDAVVIACFYNPQKSPYRLLAFQKWYASIRHLHHRVLECLIGDDQRSQLPSSPWITRVHTETLLWHKETLLNKLIADLPSHYRYVFWLDTDVLFTNQRWLTDAVDVLADRATIVQPFTYGVHLERHKLAPSFDVDAARATCTHPTKRHPSLWKSFGATCALRPGRAKSATYDRHGHVGFAWGARREVLDAVPLYDKAVIGGADHIMAHAAAGHIPHPCITSAFPEQQNEIEAWSRQFNAVTHNAVGAVPGDLYHLWHGDVAKRHYFARIHGFAREAQTLTRNAQGFWQSARSHSYMARYYREREVESAGDYDYDGYDAGFYEIMGYALADIAQLFGPNSYHEPAGHETPYTESPVNAVELKHGRSRARSLPWSLTDFHKKEHLMSETAHPLAGHDLVALLRMADATLAALVRPSDTDLATEVRALAVLFLRAGADTWPPTCTVARQPITAASALPVEESVTQEPAVPAETPGMPLITPAELVAFRRKHHVSQGWVGQRLGGVRAQTVSAWERGEVAIPDEMQERLAAFIRQTEEGMIHGR